MCTCRGVEVHRWGTGGWEGGYFGFVERPNVWDQDQKCLAVVSTGNSEANRKTMCGLAQWVNTLTICSWSINQQINCDFSQ